MSTRAIEAAVTLIVCDERVLVLRRRPNERSFANQWCLPGGRIERGETPEQSAVREALEETGLEVSLEHALGPRAIELPERGIEFRIHRFVARCTSSTVVVSEEHVDARWLTREEAAIAAALLPSGLAGEVTAELLDRFANEEGWP